MENIQETIAGMSRKWKQEREETQMTLGEMISVLKVLPKSTKIKGLGDLSSYRGYYSDLSFEPASEYKDVKALLKDCEEAVGKTYRGYKGGDYIMSKLTPLWVSEYGRGGERIMGINKDNIIELAEEDIYN